MSEVQTTSEDRPAQDARATIASLTHENRLTPDPERERELVYLRNAAYFASPASPRPEPWPEPYADPFPDVVDDLVWITPDQLDPAVLGGALRHHGCLAVRGLIDPERAAQLAEHVEEVFASREEQEGREAPATTADAYQPFEPAKGAKSLEALRTWVRNAGAVFAADAPHVLYEVLEDLDAVGLVEVVEGYLGERPALSVNKTSLRKVPPSAVPAWHQDGAFLGDDVRAVNLWVALTPCGGDRPVPGLDIIPRRLPGLVETGTDGAMFAKRVGQGAVDRLGAPTLRPEFDLGDALLFDEIFLHRTATDPAMTGNRYALEWWMFSPSGFPPGYVPLAV